MSFFTSFARSFAQVTLPSFPLAFRRQVRTEVARPPSTTTSARALKRLRQARNDQAIGVSIFAAFALGYSGLVQLRTALRMQAERKEKQVLEADCQAVSMYAKVEGIVEDWPADRRIAFYRDAAAAFSDVVENYEITTDLSSECAIDGGDICSAQTFQYRNLSALKDSNADSHVFEGIYTVDDIDLSYRLKGNVDFPSTVAERFTSRCAAIEQRSLRPYAYVKRRAPPPARRPVQRPAVGYSSSVRWKEHWAKAGDVRFV